MLATPHGVIVGCRCVAVLALVAFTPTRAWADSPDPALAAAQHEFEEGEKRFHLGRFDEALDHFEKAYLAKPLPELLYNIGRCRAELGRHREAVQAYRSYLQGKPKAPNRHEVEGLIAKETALADKLGDRPAPAPVVVKPPSPPPSIGKAEAATPRPPPPQSPLRAEVPQQPAPVEIRPPDAQTHSSAVAVANPNQDPLPARSDVREPVPVYKKWWLWTAVGAVVVGGAAAAGVGIALGSPKDGPIMPGLFTYDVPR